MNKLLDHATVSLAAIAATYVILERPWLRWGATPSERHRALSGRRCRAACDGGGTRAITIDAPAEGVWPWLVQMGYGRAGWYSLDRWDNGGQPSADHIVPELQDVKVGDMIADATGPSVSASSSGSRIAPSCFTPRSPCHRQACRSATPGGRALPGL